MKTLRYQHLRFHALKIGEDFFSGIQRYYKASFFTGRTILDGELVVIMPWVKVRSARPFGKPVVCAVGTDNVGFGSAAATHLSKGNDNIYLSARPPQAVTPGGDRTPEAIGGNELTPSA